MIFDNSIKHGTANAYNLGCRCNRCKKAKSVYRKEAPIFGHGTKWYYDKGCRCDLCVNASMEYRRKLHPNIQKPTTNCVEGTRICYTCKIDKSLNDFVKNSNKRAFMGRGHECKICHNARGKRNKNTPAYRYSTYKSGAKVREIEFNLSFEEFVSFWNSPCFYCGDSIEGIGLDRKDPKIGYQTDNIVPCCSQCNRAKTIQTTESFIEMCKKVARKFENHVVPPQHSVTSLVR